LDDLPGGNPFGWCFASQSPEISQQIETLTTLTERYDVSTPTTDPQEESDLLKALYQDLFPRRLRHRLGEYYTPDWLAQHVLDQVGFEGKPGQRLLDPACGSGTFLMLALQQARREHEKHGKTMPRDEKTTPKDEPSVFSFSPLTIVGCDINPLAVLTARANYVMAMHDCLPKNSPVEIPVYLADSILNRPPHAAFSEPFDFVVGNPPWIAWDYLPEAYRQASRSLWQQYGLFSLSGNAARHGGGKKDLSMLMLYTSADRYLKSSGRLGMVITQTLFQTKGAGDGFRHFQLGADGEPLKVLRVDDMVALRPFDAANWTSVILLEKGSPTVYPVPYFKWTDNDHANDVKCLGPEGDGAKKTSPAQPKKLAATRIPVFSQKACSAFPIDPARRSSPWLIQDDTPKAMKSGAGDAFASGKTTAANESTATYDASQGGPSDYTAHLGANTGGANGVYWLEVLGSADGGILVRNMPGRGKQSLEIIEAVIEPDLLYPLARWSDVKRYSATPRCHILLAQDVVTRSGIDEQIMRERYPRTLAYLERFHDFLTTRAAYRRYQHGGPFYSMYNVGEYTVAPIKVIWRRMDRQINAVVVEAADTPWLGTRPIVPQETCVLIACDTVEEAHYLCALLNSDSVNERIVSHSVRGGKGFGTPSMLEYLGLKQFVPYNSLHQDLAARSRAAHAATRRFEL
jgi:SAM-dependent methyltransferase